MKLVMKSVLLLERSYARQQHIGSNAIPASVAYVTDATASRGVHYGTAYKWLHSIYSKSCD